MLNGREQRIIVVEFEYYVWGEVIEMERIFRNGLQVDGCWEGDILMFLWLMAQ